WIIHGLAWTYSRVFSGQPRSWPKQFRSPSELNVEWGPMGPTATGRSSPAESIRVPDLNLPSQLRRRKQLAVDHFIFIAVMQREIHQAARDAGRLAGVTGGRGEGHLRGPGDGGNQVHRGRQRPPRAHSKTVYVVRRRQETLNRTRIRTRIVFPL